MFYISARNGEEKECLAAVVDNNVSQATLDATHFVEDSSNDPIQRRCVNISPPMSASTTK